MYSSLQHSQRHMLDMQSHMSDSKGPEILMYLSYSAPCADKPSFSVVFINSPAVANLGTMNRIAVLAAHLMPVENAEHLH